MHLLVEMASKIVIKVYGLVFISTNFGITCVGHIWKACRREERPVWRARKLSIRLRFLPIPAVFIKASELAARNVLRLCAFQ